MISPDHGPYSSHHLPAWVSTLARRRVKLANTQFFGEYLEDTDTRAACFVTVVVGSFGTITGTALCIGGTRVTSDGIYFESGISSVEELYCAQGGGDASYPPGCAQG